MLGLYDENEGQARMLALVENPSDFSGVLAARKRALVT